MPADRNGRSASSVGASVFYPAKSTYRHSPTEPPRQSPLATHSATRALTTAASTMPPLTAMSLNRALDTPGRAAGYSPKLVIATPDGPDGPRVAPAVAGAIVPSPVVFGSDELTEYPFPHVVESPTLVNQMAQWSLHTPSTTIGGPTSSLAWPEPDVLLTGPDDGSSHLALGTVFEHQPVSFEQARPASFGADVSPRTLSNAADAPAFPSPRLKAKRPTIGPSRSANSIPRASSTFFISSPVRPVHRLQSPLASPLSPLLPRQTGWPDRRASAPSPLSPAHDLPRATTPAQALDADVDLMFAMSPHEFGASLFSPDYTMTCGLARDDYTFAPLPAAVTCPPPAPATDLAALLPAPASLDAPQSRSEVADSALAGHLLNPDFAMRYTVGDELGHGGFGFVCTAVQTGYDNEPGVEVAVKFIYKARFTESYGPMVNGEPLESAILKVCNHPGVIRWLGLYEDSKFFCLVQELHGNPWDSGHTLEPPAEPHVVERPKPKLTHSSSTPTIPTARSASPLPSTPHAASSSLGAGSHWHTPPSTGHLGVATPIRPFMGRRASHDLFECVEHQRFTEAQARYVFRQLVDAVHYMHSMRIYHRDLKDENCVIDRELRVKIIDFGSAVLEDPNCGPIVYHDFHGTSSYAPPEVLAGESYMGGPCDVWALGIILAILLTGNSPFASPDDAKAGNMRFRHAVPREAEDLMRRCLVADEYKRANIDEVRSHPWLAGAAWWRNSI